MFNAQTSLTRSVQVIDASTDTSAITGDVHLMKDGDIMDDAPN